MRNRLIISSIIAITLLASCGDNMVDIVPPAIQENAFIPAPTEGDICGSVEPKVFKLNGGDILGFDFVFTDDVALSQYKVDIHNNFDCHGHGGGSAPSVAVPNVTNQTEDWSVLEIQPLSGTSAPIVWSTTVPSNVTAGNYHFQIQVIDESGNDDPLANFYALKIKNPRDTLAPMIDVVMPAKSSFEVIKGQNIRFVGQVNDDRSLSDGGNGILYLAYTNLSSGNTFTTSAVFPFDNSVGTQYDFDFEYTIPQTIVSGPYRFSLGANDGVRNVAAFTQFEVEVR